MQFLKKHGLETIFDAEHFYDGYRENPEYAMKVLRAVAEAGADAIVLCDTNGGTMPNDIYDITKTVCNLLSPADDRHSYPQRLRSAQPQAPSQPSTQAPGTCREQ